MSPPQPARVDACLVAGGKYHDIDFARMELLGLLAEHSHIRVEVRHDWEDIETLARADLIVSYTCDIRPTEQSQHALRSWVERGGRWFALHGTNAALDLSGPGGVDTPPVFPDWVDTLGSQFIAHPPIAPIQVEPAAPTHWLVAGIAPFTTTDELYLMDHPNRDSLQPLLATRWRGEAPGFTASDWTNGTGEHLISYLRPLGGGAVLYNTLGHCRGHYDMIPRHDFHPTVERCSWETAAYYELLRRGIRWTLGATA